MASNLYERYQLKSRLPFKLSCVAIAVNMALR
jgi:hypothetical protein